MILFSICKQYQEPGGWLQHTSEQELDVIFKHQEGGGPGTIDNVAVHTLIADIVQ